MIRLRERFAFAKAIFAAAILVGAVAPTVLGESTPVGIEGVRNFSAESYHADRQNWAVVEDKRGIFYFGNSAGVLEFDGSRWRLIKLPDGRGADALAKAADGRILVGSEGDIGWLVADQLGSMVYQSDAADLPAAFRTSGDRVIQIFDSPEGRVFLSDHWLFLRAANRGLTSVSSVDHFLQAAWFHGALYVLDSARGLTRLDGKALVNIPGGAEMRGLTMQVTDAGLLIPTFSDGLVRYSPDSVNPWTILNAKGWSAINSEDVTSSVALNKNLIALGTAKQGVMLVNSAGNVVEQIGAGEGLADDHVYSINYDHIGGLWLAVDNGVWLTSLNLPRDADAPPFQAFIRSFVGTNDERLLYGGAMQGNQTAAQVLKFPYNYNEFRFQYAANGINATGDIQFQTYMQGVDKDWSVWSTRSEREFTQLAPGTWEFRVRARLPDGEISQEGVYTFRITPAWYNTWWFLIFQFCFVIGILVLPGHTPHPRLQEALTTFAVVMPFVYVGEYVGDLIHHYYSTDIAFVQILISASLAAVLDPMQSYLKKRVQERSKKLEKMREHLVEEVEHMEQAMAAEGHHLVEEMEEAEHAVAAEGHHLVEEVEHMMGEHHHHKEGPEDGDEGTRD